MFNSIINNIGSLLTFRLPSFSELILSFNLYLRYESTRPKTLRLASSSERPSIMAQQVPGSDFTSLRNSKVEGTISDSNQSYSHGHNNFRHYSYQFPSETAEVTSQPDKNHPIHSKSSSLPNIRYAGISEESTQKNEEKNLLSSLSKMLDSSFHNKEMLVIRNNYFTLVEQAPERINEDSSVLHGYITSSNHTKFITHESFKQFVLTTSPQNIDNLILEYNDNVATLKRFKAMILQYSKEEELAANKSLTKMSLPRVEPFYFAQSSPTPKPSTGTKTSSKRRKSSNSNINTMSKTQTTSHNVGGSIIPLEIKKPTLYSGSSASTLGLGALNPELSVRQEIYCNHCGSKSTPEWRKGMDGNRTLCNACGLFYSKLAKKYNAEEAARIMEERKKTGSVNNRRIK